MYIHACTACTCCSCRLALDRVVVLLVSRWWADDDAVVVLRNVCVAAVSVSVGKRVQEGCHDSIEDARTALFLYRRYEELKNSGQLQDTLVNLYEAGREMQWKVPARN